MATVLWYLLVFVEVVTCLLLIFVVLLQRSKDGGLGGMAFGSGMGESLFGARAGNVLTRATVILAVIFLVVTTMLARLGVSRRTRSAADDIKPTAGAAPMPSSMPEPMAPAGPAAIPAPVEVPSGGGPAIPAPTPVER